METNTDCAVSAAVSQGKIQDRHAPSVQGPQLPRTVVLRHVWSDDARHLPAGSQVHWSVSGHTVRYFTLIHIAM